MTEEFIVEVPKISDLSVGEVVESNMTVNLRKDFCERFSNKSGQRSRGKSLFSRFLCHRAPDRCKVCTTSRGA